MGSQPDTLTVKWPHDVHVLVNTEALAKRIGSRVGALVHIHAGQSFEMDKGEALARLADGVGGSLEVVDPDELKAAQGDAAAQVAETAVVLTDQSQKAPADHEAALQGLEDA